MARDHARIRLSIWSDPDFLALTESAQRAYLLGLSQPGINYCGVLPFTLKRWSSLAGDSTTIKLRKAFTALETGRYVAVDESSEEMLIRSFLRHDGVLGSPNISKAAATAYTTVHSPYLRGLILIELHKLNNGPQDDSWEKGWPYLSTLLDEPLPEGFPKGFGEDIPNTLRDSCARADPDPSPDPDPVLRAVTDQPETLPAHAFADCPAPARHAHHRIAVNS